MNRKPPTKNLHITIEGLPELIKVISKGFDNFNKKQDKIMGLIDELKQASEDLKTQVMDLQNDVDAKQEAISTSIANLNQTILDLKAQIEAGAAATPEQLQAVLDNVTATKDLLTAVDSDVESTPTE